MLSIQLLLGFIRYISYAFLSVNHPTFSESLLEFIFRFFRHTIIELHTRVCDSKVSFQFFSCYSNNKTTTYLGLIRFSNALHSFFTRQKVPYVFSLEPIYLCIKFHQNQLSSLGIHKRQTDKH
uniref:Uncharacterized protein n=1 Tax=Sipha flava TaxID=143950 RepID=A0A2S2QMM8_9HEMI